MKIWNSEILNSGSGMKKVAVLKVEQFLFIMSDLCTSKMYFSHIIIDLTNMKYRNELIIP
jgi:hypothetical protein